MITSPAFRGKRYFVLGLARSGLATVESLIASGAEVVAWDASEAAREKIRPGTGRGTARSVVEGAVSAPSSTDTLTSIQPPPPPPLRGGPPPRSRADLTLADPLTISLSGFDGIVVSPGVPINRHPIADAARAAGVPLIGDIELFAMARAHLPRHKVVGITGTNGKSTTTALIHHILTSAGVPSLMGGNIGLPILGRDPLPAGGVYVLELSSYQIDLTFTLDCDMAILTNITPDHLDRYDGFEGYAASKRRLFEMQSSDHPIAVSTSTQTALDQVDGFEQMIWRMSPDVDEPLQANWPSLQGPHNLENAQLARITCWCLGLNHIQINNALATYPGLPHRMERIRELHGVLYVNDSKATNATSTAPALAAYPSVHWILGGQAKTNELDACVPHFGHIRAAYTIGDAGEMFAALLAPHMKVSNCKTLDAAIALASAAAKAGETVLLSPACASFDQFKDYEARGEAFRSAVEALI